MKTDFISNPDFRVIAGSRLYGINNPDSDYDYRGFVVAPTEINPSLFENFESANTASTIDNRTSDNVIYSLAKFLKMCVAGQINILEILYAPQPQIIKYSDVANHICFYRNNLLSQNIYRSIRGFSLSEFNRAFVCSTVPVEKYKDKTQAFLDSLTGFQLRSFEILALRQHLEDIIGTPLVEYVEQPQRVEAKRREMYETYGYDTKSGANAIRLLDQGAELLTDRYITFPCRTANLLKEIRNGAVSKEDLKKLFKEYETKLDEAFKQTKLPKKPEEAIIEMIYLEAIDIKKQSEERLYDLTSRR